MPQLDVSTYTSQIFWLCVSFLMMFFIMSQFIVPKISEIMSQRQRKIDDYLSAAHEFKMQTEEIVEKYEEALEKANKKADEAMGKARQTVQELIDKSQKEADDKLKLRLSESEKQIAEIRQDAAEKAEIISIDLAADIAAKIGLKISKESIIQSAGQGGDK